MEELLTKYLNEGYIIIDTGTDTKGIKYYAITNCGTINLINEIYNPFNTLAKLHFEPRIENKYEKRIYLVDIWIAEVDSNKGYGSILMKSLIKYAKLNDFNEIYGKLSPVDNDSEEHIKRRNHFYKKFGFEINNNNIKLIL